MRRREFFGVVGGAAVALAAFCWFLFLAGHIVNNVRGFVS